MSTTDDTGTTTPPTDATAGEARPAPRRRRAASRPAGPPAADTAETGPASVDPPAAAAPPAKRSRAKKAPATEPRPDTGEQPGGEPEQAAPAKRTRAKKAPATPATQAPSDVPADSEPVPVKRTRAKKATATFSTVDEPVVADAAGAPAASLMFHAPEPAAPVKRTRAKKAPAATSSVDEAAAGESEVAEDSAADPGEHTDQGAAEGTRRRRRRGGRGRRRATDEDPGAGADTAAETAAEPEPADTGDGEGGEESDSGEAGSSRRRRRRRRSKSGGEDGPADEPRSGTGRTRQSTRRHDEITSVKGSTRLEAKKQRRREGREAGRRRPSILTEAEFLARREAVERVMVVRELTDRTQIAVLEDGVLVEHYVNRSTGASMIGNVYLGRVQNVLPSMEAAFVDIGRGRNAVLYAGEVNWDAAGLDGQPRRIESALKSGDSVLVQVTKDPLGHKGARLTSQISLPGRFLVYVPRGEMTGISRKLPDTERTRLKAILRDIVPEDAGVIVRTAAEGASEADLTRDVQRLTEQWDEIERGARTASAPALLHGEPDLAIKVVRDIFNEDFHRLVVSGADAWETLEPYVQGVAPELVERLEKWTGTDEVFHAHRVDEQLAKALDRKVWLPSGGSLVIDRTEAMTVVDVNTGKFTGSGGNLEETVTRNNLEAAEEIVRQLRLRDIGGIIVVDFIDMVLESNRDLVLRRLLECLGRDRTKHQVAEVTSLGLVQMTRKRIGQGLLEVFSEPCEQCHGRGVLVHSEPLESKGPRADQAPVHDAVKSASVSAGAAKVHAAARRAEAAAHAPQPSADGDGDGEVVAAVAADTSAAPDAAVDEEPAPPRARATRRRATRAAGSASAAPLQDAEPVDALAVQESSV